MSPLYQVIAVSEALIGFGILTLTITYVIGIYEVLRHLASCRLGSITRPGTTP